MASSELVETFSFSAADGFGFTGNQMEYSAGRKTSVSTVPAAVPPMSV
jgi:hypothetical protein